VAAAASLGALLLTRPALTDSMWSRGDELALVVAWVVAVAASAWLFVTTGVCVIALGCTRPALAQRLAGALPFGVRRLVELAIVGPCVVLPALPARAAGPPPVARVVVADQPVVRAPAPTTTSIPTVAPAPAPAPARPGSAPTPSRVVVRAGDNLWLIARASLMQASGRRPGEAEIARYWHAVIAANRSTLRSGDPSLIFPGEIVALPPPAAVS